MKTMWLMAVALVGVCSASLVSADIPFEHASASPHESERDHADRKDRIFITDDDGSISLIERVHDRSGAMYKETGQVQVGLSQPHWPANQYEGGTDWWWVGVPTGFVRGFHARPGMPLADLAKAENQVTVNTYTYSGIAPGLPTKGESFAGITPDGKQLWNSAREIDEIQQIDANPHSPTFGQILTHIHVPLSAKAGTGSATLGKMRPCDMSIAPNGKYLFEPDLGGETITAVDIHKRKVISQLELEPLVQGTRVAPFMLTTNGKIALVETLEGQGHYAVIDVRDPRHMHEIKRITQDDGLGVRPMTNEFSPDGKYAYLITNGSPTVPPQISVLALDDLQIVNNIALANDCQPFAGDFSKDGRHFFVACPGNSTVAVVDTRSATMVQQVAISGAKPRPRGVIVQ